MFLTDSQFHHLGVSQVTPRRKTWASTNVIKAERDKGAFKTPMLRSMSQTALYMHDGRLKTLAGCEKTILALQNFDGQHV